MLVFDDAIDHLGCYMDLINIYFTDAQYDIREIHEIDRWATDNCACYHGVKVIDVSDFSLLHDYTYEFHFTSQQDVLLFKLTWT